MTIFPRFHINPSPIPDDVKPAPLIGLLQKNVCYVCDRRFSQNETSEQIVQYSTGPVGLVVCACRFDATCRMAMDLSVAQYYEENLRLPVIQTPPVSVLRTSGEITPGCVIRYVYLDEKTNPTAQICAQVLLRNGGTKGVPLQDLFRLNPVSLPSPSALVLKDFIRLSDEFWNKLHRQIQTAFEMTRSNKQKQS
jgi:hypothetical protein